jgi:hypothetical protein
MALENITKQKNAPCAYGASRLFYTNAGRIHFSVAQEYGFFLAAIYMLIQ